MRGTAIALLVGLAATPAWATDTPADTPAPTDGEHLVVSFFSSGFMAAVVARIETERTERERLAGGYLQESTGLVWARGDNGADVDWFAADDYCSELELADWTDWRLPTLAELEKLHDRRSNSTYKLPAAIELTGCCPWSDTRNGDSSAWNFSFRYRKPFSGSLNYSYQLRALCVRPATAEDILFFERIAEELEEKAKRR